MRRAPAPLAFFLRLLTLTTLIVGGTASVAHAAVVQYMSKHPLPRRVGRGFCYIDVPHFHDYPPSDPRLYRQIDNQYYFVGDPAPFEYEGPRYAFYGPHPVVDAGVQLGGPTYCYLRGPHYHWYAPPAQAQFEMRGGAYWYVGAYDPVFYRDRPRFAVVNEAYTPLVYPRPIVDVTIAPPAFRGEIVAGGPGWRGQAVVANPLVAAGVVVAPPPPPIVGLGVGINLGGPPPPVVERRDIYLRERHDHEPDGWRGPPRGPGWRGGPPPPHRAAGGWHGGPVAPGPRPEAHPHGGGWRGGPAPQQHHAGGPDWRH